MKSIAESTDWTHIGSILDWEAVEELTDGGHDGVVKEMHWSHGEYVNNDLQMVYTNSPSVSMIIQLQSEKCPSIEFRLEGVSESCIRTKEDIQIKVVFVGTSVTLELSGLGSRVVAKSIYYKIPERPLLGTGPFSSQ